MDLRKIVTALSVTAVGALVLTGCSIGFDTGDAPKKGVDKSSTAPTEETEPEGEAPAGDSEPSADVAAPGTKAGLGEWLSYDYTGTDKQKAVIAARVVAIEAASAEQTDFLISEIPQLKGYKVSFIKVEQKKVSGDPVKFNADYTAFKPVSSAGVDVQQVTVIGWDECKVASFTEEFDTAGAVLTQCLIAASVEGGEEAAGVMYAQYDTAYAKYDGKPLLFVR